VIREALDRLSRAGVPFATRGEQPIDDPPAGGDVDILVAIRDERATARALEGAGFHQFVAPGNRRHRFFLAFDHERGRWLKIDVTLVPRRFRWDLSARDEASLRRFASYRVGSKARQSRAERVRVKLARRRPLGLRRQGPVVAILGPDGAGKGSVIAALRSEIPVQVTPLYFGHGDSSAREYGAHRPERSGAAGGALRAGRAAVALMPDELADAQRGVRRALRSTLRAWKAHVRAWRGDAVLCDRHPVEVLANTTHTRSLGRALERRLVRRLVPWPDRIVLLEAPGEELFARKGEHSPEILDTWARAYREAFGGRATVIETTQPLAHSVARASAVVWQALGERRGW
jgi:thymidylate kinase